MGRFIIIILGVLLVAVRSYASSVPSLDEHADFLQTVIAALIFVLMFFAQRNLARIEGNQKDLLTLVGNLKAEVDTLKGEHNAMKEICASHLRGGRP